MSSDFVWWLCLWLNAKTLSVRDLYKKIRFFRYYFKKEKNLLPQKRALALKVRRLSSNKAMDYQLVPFQRVVLTLQNATNPGPVAQFV